MPDMNFTDAAELGSARITADGYLVADVRCARTGCQQYAASDIGLSGTDPVTVYRSEDVVFDKASLATFAGKPVTVGHPSEPVTADNWRALAVGDLGTEIARDGEFVRVPVKLMDAAAIHLVRSGAARQVSMGYTTGIEIKDGIAPDGTPYQAIQTGPIRINHLAIVAQARGGHELRIGDAAAPWGIAPLTNDEREIGMADTILKTVVLGDQAAQVAQDSVQAVEAFKAATAKQLADAQTVHDKAMAAKDIELAKRDTEIADLKAKVLDDAALDARVQARVAVVGAAKAIMADAKIDGLSDAQIRRAVVAAKLGDAAIAGKSDDYIAARFDGLAETAKPDAFKGAMADAKTGTLVALGDYEAQREANYKAHLADLQTAYLKKGA